MLDKGESPNKVSSWINKNGFKISAPMVYEYAKLRKQAIVNGINISHVMSVTAKSAKPEIDKSNPVTKKSINKLKSEITALDKIIEGGYETISNWDGPISPRLMMEAISLKNRLTEGSHNFLTVYGMEELRDIEQQKYNLIIEHLVNFIPEDKKEIAIKSIAVIEDEYYQTTDYYEEYLKAQNLPEEEIAKKLEYWEKTRDKH